MAALEFDSEDLDANRYGYMTKKQRNTLSKNRRVWRLLVWAAIISTLIAIVVAILDGIRIQDTVSSRIGVCLVILVLGGAQSFYSYSKVRNYNRDLLKGDIVRVGGIITEYHSGERGQTAIRIGDQIFRTNSRDRFYGFDYGEAYTIFYAPFSKYILSAQLLHQPNTEPEVAKILKANTLIE
ncbi:MAG: hypothetical protein LCI00_01340 [Chloroflexi bacterium]|nr:hypothetical protein [Chloroflexota bacterium]MCC6895665.1 hypothetical protein [Anaerolineae bacterium]